MGHDCWSQREALLTNCSHEIIYQIYANSMSLTHWYQYYQILPPRIWWQLTCASLSCSLAIWSMTNLVFMCEGIQALLTSWWTFVSIYHSIWRPLTSLPTYFHLSLPMYSCNFTNAYPEMWKFCKNCVNDNIPWARVMIQNLSKQCQC